MLIKVKKPYDLRESDVTDERLYRSRRHFLKSGVHSGVALSMAGYLPQMARASVNQFKDRFSTAPTTHNH